MGLTKRVVPRQALALTTLNNNPQLETEPKRRVDAAIVCATTAAAKSAEATRRRRRLSEQARSDVADGICEVRMVQQVLEVD